MRRLLLLLAALAVMVLAGCRLDVDVDVDVAADGSGTVAVTAVADADVVSRAPKLAEDLDFKDAIAAGWKVDGPSKSSNGSMRVVVSHDFATVEEATALLASINGPGGPLHDVALTRASAADEITISLAGTLRIDGGLDAFADPDLLKALGAAPYAQQIADAQLTPAEAVSIDVAAHLPGRVQSSATPKDGKVSWPVPLDGTAVDIATSSITSRSNPGGGGFWRFIRTTALVLAIAWAVAAAVLVWLVHRARQRRAARRNRRGDGVTRSVGSRRRT